MKRAMAFAVVFGLALVFTGAAAAQFTQLPTLPTMQNPPRSTWQPNLRDHQRQMHQREMQRQSQIWESFRQSQQRKPIPWRNFVDSPAERQRHRDIFMDQRRQSEADHLNYLRDCAKYNRGCFNELGGR